MEPIILSLLHDRVAMARLATAARTVATIEGCVCAEGVRRSAAARLEVAAVILDVDVPDRRSTIPMIADLRARHPMLPVILYARVRRETGEAITWPRHFRPQTEGLFAGWARR